MEQAWERQRFGERVRALRERRGWPLDELAIRLDKSRASISRIENGKQNLTFDDITAIARALEVGTSTLFRDESDVQGPESEEGVRKSAAFCAKQLREAMTYIATAQDTLETISAR